MYPIWGPTYVSLSRSPNFPKMYLTFAGVSLQVFFANFRFAYRYNAETLTPSSNFTGEMMP